MKQLFFKFLVAFLITSAVVLSWSEYFYFTELIQKKKKGIMHFIPLILPCHAFGTDISVVDCSLPI